MTDRTPATFLTGASRAERLFPTLTSAQLCRGEEVVVVDWGNAAGQAAVFLAQTAKRVHMLVRPGGRGIHRRCLRASGAARVRG